MSIVSNIHTATVYDAKHSRAMQDQRLVVTIAKADKNGNYGPHLQQTMCTSIPQIDVDQIEECADILLPHIVNWLESQQNAMIAERIKEGKKEVSTDELSVLSVVTWLERESVSERWNSERVARWFDESLAENIGVKLLSDGKDEQFVEKALENWGKMFANALGSKAAIPRKVAEALLKPLALANEGDKAAEKFVARCKKVLEEKDLNAELGLDCF